MTTPEQVLIRRRLQPKEDQARAAEAAAAAERLKQEDHWVADIISNLAGFIRKIG
jgi:hypothetical protein